MELIIVAVFLIIIGCGIAIFYNLYLAMKGMVELRKLYWDAIRSKEGK